MGVALDFLVGHFRGEGTWGEQAFVCRTRGELLVDRFLQLSVEAEGAGGRSHREMVIVHPEGETLVATLYPDRGDVQRFQVLEREAGHSYRLVFTPPGGSGLTPQRWTIERTLTGYRELYEVAEPDGTFRPAVTCTYERQEP